MDRVYDIILYGATGFTGRQTVQYFHENAPQTLSWAIAGRNKEKLAQLAASYAPERTIDYWVASGDDREALGDLCARTRVILTTAGPFSAYGRALVDACVEHGVHYTDITGETPFVADLIRAYHARAEAAGTRIVPFCGFDSVPSDAVAYLAAQYFRSKGKKLQSVFNGFTVRGGLNGGTMATAFMLSASNQGAALRDVFLLNPEAHKPSDEARFNKDLRAPLHHPRLGWMAPFFMGPVNTRVVRRSHALFAQDEQSYGDTFRYQEAWSCRSSWQAKSRTLSLGVIDGLMRRHWGRACVRPWVPKPGRGPSVKTMDQGFFRCQAIATAEDGEEAEVRMVAQGDPGNRVTVTALCEAALALATDDLSSVTRTGGVLTPMTGLGDTLIARLKGVGWEMSVRPLDAGD